MKKKWGTWHIMSPPSRNVGAHVPRVPHQIAPMPEINFYSSRN